MLEKKGSIKNAVGRISSLFSMGLTSLFFSNEEKSPEGRTVYRGGPGSGVTNAAKGAPPAPSMNSKADGDAAPQVGENGDTVPQVVSEIAQNLASHSIDSLNGPVPDARPLVDNKGPEIGH